VYPTETRFALMLALEVSLKHQESKPFQTGVLQV
jgi:hypothetical protein